MSIYNYTQKKFIQIVMLVFCAWGLYLIGAILYGRVSDQYPTIREQAVEFSSSFNGEDER